METKSDCDKGIPYANLQEVQESTNERYRD